jgi:homoserine O-acetyltransferase
MTGSLDAVESRIFQARDFALDSGAVLPELRIAYETYGALAADRRNAVLLTHGYTSHHHNAGRYRAGHAPPGLDETTPGTWDRLVGPGRAIDTERLFVVSSNMLGSSYGSTGPGHTDPRTGKPYGPSFPAITVADIVRAQKLLLDRLGVQHLVAVAGPSYGGYQAFQWAVQYPDFMHGIVPTVTSPKSAAGPGPTQKLIADLATDPNWNGGDCYANGGIFDTLVKTRVQTLRFYGIEAQLSATMPDAAQRDGAIRRLAEAWARVFDANAMVVLRRALERFDSTAHFDRIRAKVLYVLSRTDRLFPPSLAPGVLQLLERAGVDARYLELDSEFGHLATGVDADKWAPVLAGFMAELQRDAGLVAQA